MTSRCTWNEFDTTALPRLTPMTSLGSPLVTPQPRRHSPLCHTHLHLSTTKPAVLPPPFPASSSSSLRPRRTCSALLGVSAPFTPRDITPLGHRHGPRQCLQHSGSSIYVRLMPPPTKKARPSRTCPAGLSHCLMDHGLLSGRIWFLVDKRAREVESRDVSESTKNAEPVGLGCVTVTCWALWDTGDRKRSLLPENLACSFFLAVSIT